MWVQWGNQILKEEDKIAIDLNCCCPDCCEDKMVTGVVLLATVIADTTGCVPVGTVVEMTDATSPLIWSTNGVCLKFPWEGLLLACFNYVNCKGQTVEALSLFWQFNAGCGGGCPEVDTALNLPCQPVLIPWGWTHGVRSCIPINFTFTYCINEVSPPSTCPCLTGCFTIRITQKP